MTTRAELIAAAEALEWAIERCQIEHDGYIVPRGGWQMSEPTDSEYSGYQRACNDLRDNFRRHAAELLAQAAALSAQEPVAWIRFASDGGYDGPIADVDRRMDEIRKNSGAWTPLYTTPPDQTARIAALESEIQQWRNFAPHNRKLLRPLIYCYTFNPCADHSVSDARRHPGSPRRKS